MSSQTLLLTYLPTKPIGILTCQNLDEFKAQDKELIESLSRRGYKAESIIWNQPTTKDWSLYQAIVVSSTWDCFKDKEKYRQFLATLKVIF